MSGHSAEKGAPRCEHVCEYAIDVGVPEYSGLRDGSPGCGNCAHYVTPRDEITTCSRSLLEPGKCCVDKCNGEATEACLDPALIEHGLCQAHALVDGYLATKPMLWSDAWGPQ